MAITLPRLPLQDLRNSLPRPVVGQRISTPLGDHFLSGDGVGRGGGSWSGSGTGSYIAAPPYTAAGIGSKTSRVTPASASFLSGSLSSTITLGTASGSGVVPEQAGAMLNDAARTKPGIALRLLLLEDGQKGHEPESILTGFIKVSH